MWAFRYPIVALAFLLLASVAAFADEAKPQDIVLTLSPSEVGYIWGVLAERPFKDVAALMAKMQAQVQAAANAQATPPKLSEVQPKK